MEVGFLQVQLRKLADNMEGETSDLIIEFKYWLTNIKIDVRKYIKRSGKVTARPVGKK